MSIQKGMYIRVETKASPGQNKDETPFGTVVWYIDEIGLPFRVDKNTTLEGKGVKCIMVGGSGEMARAGYSCIDNIDRMIGDMKKGISAVVSEHDVKRLESTLRQVAETGAVKGGASGCVEID